MVGASRRAIEGLYEGRCAIVVRQGVKDPETRRTSMRETVLREDIPCRLSHKTVAAAGDPSPASAVTQTIKLFLAPEIEVPAGSKIIVTQNGRTGEYCRSGQPAAYGGHQEIVLELFQEWA